MQLHIEELQHQFDSDLPDDVKQPLVIYARNFLEFCSFQALQVATTQPDYLSDKDFRRLMFDMMLAWEAPGVGNQVLNYMRYHLVALFQDFFLFLIFKFQLLCYRFGCPFVRLIF